MEPKESDDMAETMVKEEREGKTGGEESGKRPPGSLRSSERNGETTEKINGRRAEKTCDGGLGLG